MRVGTELFHGKRTPHIPRSISGLLKNADGAVNVYDANIIMFVLSF